ncbi:hypothetical protein ACIQLJ_13450 [Microbacterium sp. NPDC091313]
MTKSNRFLNRLLLLVVGLGFIAVGAVIVLPQITGAPLPLTVSADDPLVTWGVIAAAAIVLIIAIAWISTRGRGRTRYAVATSDVRVDASAVADVVRDALSKAPDVAGVKVAGYTVRRRRVLAVTVLTRRHPDLEALVRDIRTATDRMDAVLGAKVPAVVHVTTGLRTAFSGERATR